MKFRHFLLVILLVALWGFNFAIIRVALAELPPLLLCSTRFFFCAFPAVFIWARPKTSWLLLSSYGLVLFAIQFGLLFCGLKLGMPAGLASLVMQVQPLFTMLLAAFILRDKISLWKVCGALISLTGVALVAERMSGSASMVGLLLTLLASLAWAMGNILSKIIGKTSSIALVAWGSLVAFPALVILSLFMEGPARIYESLAHLSWLSVGAIFYISYMSTLVAYSTWTYLLNTYPIAMIAPFSLLVPIFGFLGSMLILDEAMPWWKVVASVLIVFGLAFNMSEGKWQFRKPT